MENRRDHLRVALSTDVMVARDRDTFPAVSVNVSTGGVLLDCGVIMPGVAERLELKFSIPGLDEPVTTHAVVRWADTVRPNLVGVEFTTGLRAREVYAIQQLKGG